MPVRIVEVRASEGDREYGAKHEGKFIPVSRAITVLDEDADVYATDETGRHLLAKFRKGVIKPDVVQPGWDAFRHLAIPSRNRGPAAGPIDPDSTYFKRRKLVKTSGWLTQYLQDGKVSGMYVSNFVASGVIGNYEASASMREPCRMTSYTRRNLRHYLRGIPFIEAIDAEFRRLVPTAWRKQHDAVSRMPMYRIADTAFSTVTVNLNFRTALHKDAGDFHDGFGNLSVIEWGRYHGGETLFPRFGVGFNVRTGDFLAMDVHEWHCNGEMWTTREDDAFNATLPDVRTREAETGVVGSQERYQRLSFVCYYRDRLSECDEGETRGFYRRIKFNLRAESAKARLSAVANRVLPIPGITGSVDDAWGESKPVVAKGAGTRRRRHSR